MLKADLVAQVAKIKWFHTIDLGQGVVTPGIDDSPAKLKNLGFPLDLRGKSILDIGAWDGFFSFEAERRGASRILATDSFCWSGPGWGTKAGFELARRALDSKVEDQEIEVLDISPERVGKFDVVLFLGVLYHMRHPLLALEKIASVTKSQVILETVVDLLECEWPAMRFYPSTELHGDGSNWWGPNVQATEAMLRSVGFQRVEQIHLQVSENKQQGRVVIHAWL